MPGEPTAEVDVVECGIVRVQPAECQCGPADARALDEREVRVGGKSGGEVERDREAVAAQSAEPGPRGPPHIENRHVQTVLQRGKTCAVDPVEEPPVGGAAAQIDVLTVVDRQLAAPEGEGEAAEPGPPFQQGHVKPGVGQAQGRGDAGEPAADDDRAGGTQRSVRHTSPSRQVFSVRDASARQGVARRTE